MSKIGVLISGSGSNLQAIIDACQAGEIDGQVAVVISNKKEAYGLERARKHSIPAFYLEDDDEILQRLKEFKVNLVVLAGYLKVLPKKIVQAYPDRIINIHPSLIPSFSGQGYYGIKVHQAAIERGVKISGATVHLVNEHYDEGKILIQKAVPVFNTDSPEDLQARVLKVEHEILVEAIKELV